MAALDSRSTSHKRARARMSLGSSTPSMGLLKAKQVCWPSGVSRAKASTVFDLTFPEPFFPLALVLPLPSPFHSMTRPKLPLVAGSNSSSQSLPHPRVALVVSAAFVDDEGVREEHHLHLWDVPRNHVLLR